ncbi:MAG: fumarylacetoacetase [Bacteroidales bacterium]|nr:fumarylacetoacetase [Bacteroidales bacterium]
MTSWIEIPENSDFPLENIPFGIAKTGETISPATRIGDTVVLLTVLADYGYFDALNLDDLSIFYQPVLNDIAALTKQKRVSLRERLIHLFTESSDELKQNTEDCSTALVNINEVEMLLPVKIGDYTDFYSSIEHATNVGVMFRDPANALLPNWRHLPVGYHGRSSSIVVSGTNIHRPKGQTRPDDNLPPVFGPSKQVDFELEMGFITAGSTRLGDSIPAEEAEDHIFGMVLFNDLSARDIQRWEYVPLGPFLSKSFGSVVSPWIVTLEALEPFRVEGPKQEPAVFPYLQTSGKRNIDIELEVYIKPQQSEENLVCKSNFRHMYWNMAQQLAHQTVAGCNINPGDLYASGTISGPTHNSFGSMLELAWKGTRPIQLHDGTQRTFIQDNDTMNIRGFAQKGGLRIGFGECVTKILPAK